MPTLPLKPIFTSNTLPQLLGRVQDILATEFVGANGIVVSANANTNTLTFTADITEAIPDTVNNALHLGGQTANQLNVNSALTANVANTANMANTANFANTANVANTALTSNNALFLNGQPGSYYLNVVNFTGGTISPLLLPIANTTVNGIVDTIAQSFGGDKTFAGNLFVLGLSTFTGNATFQGFANVNTTLQVGGISTLIGNASMGGFANVNSTLQVVGTSLLQGNATFQGFANVNTTLQVGGLSVFNANVDVNASLSINMSPTANVVFSCNGQYYGPLFNNGNSGSTLTIDFSKGNQQYINLTANCTLTTTNMVDGGRYVIVINSGAGNNTVTWPANWAWPSANTPVQTANSNQLDLYTAMYIAVVNTAIGSFNQNYS